MVTAWRGPSPEEQLFDNDGNPLAGGYVYTYAAGTLTPQATYEDADQNATNSNPIQLDSSGRWPIFYGTNPYDIVVTDRLGNQIYTVSSYTIPGSSGGGGSGGGFGADTTITSSTTVDLGTITSHLATVTGTTQTNSFGSSATTDAPIYLIKAQSAGWKIVISANILCPFLTGSITSFQNDYYWLEYLGSGIWKIFDICRGDGSADFTTLRATQIVQNDA